jgi:hypothetical protein
MRQDFPTRGPLRLAGFMAPRTIGLKEGSARPGADVMTKAMNEARTSRNFDRIASLFLIKHLLGQCTAGSLRTESLNAIMEATMLAFVRPVRRARVPAAGPIGPTRSRSALSLRCQHCGDPQ